MVKVESLFKKYTAGHGEVKAVAGIHFEIKPGEFFTLLGPSGCGKSTTLRCIAGLEKPDSGEITIAGQVVFSSQRNLFVPPNLRDIAMVFQSYAIWPHMNVYGNVAYPLEGKLPKAQIREKVMEVLTMVGIEAMAQRPATQLSGGQQQRVAVARAIVKGAKVLLFDEPLSNLDAKLRIRMRTEFKSLQRRLGITAIYVTHDQEEALSLSDRIAVMNEGHIVELDTAIHIYNQPRVRFTADFVGAYNLLPGKVVRRGGEGAVACTAIGNVASLACGQALEEVMIGIRPEHIELADASTANEANVFTGTVESVLFVGKSCDCVIRVGEKDLRVQLPPAREVAEGQTVHLLFPPRFCIVLPAS